MKFFIDTADTDYIVDLWDRLSPHVARESVVGVTTNPNAMSKCNIHTMTRFARRVNELCRVVTAIRQDAKGVVYVQYPYSNPNKQDLINFAYDISWSWDGHTRVGLKIPPFDRYLKLVPDLRQSCDINVTGVADCGTALMCLGHLVRYVSLIPGRMEEKGIDANAHMRYLLQRLPIKYSTDDSFPEIITGSMRTLNGLENAIKYGTVPTIGTKVWDLILENEANTDHFLRMWDQPNIQLPMDVCPIIDSRSADLTREFFEQMDKMGEQLNKSLEPYYGLPV